MNKRISGLLNQSFGSTVGLVLWPALRTWGLQSKLCHRHWMGSGWCRSLRWIIAGYTLRPKQIVIRFRTWFIYLPKRHQVGTDKNRAFMFEWWRGSEETCSREEKTSFVGRLVISWQNQISTRSDTNLSDHLYAQSNFPPGWIEQNCCCSFETFKWNLINHVNHHFSRFSAAF